MKKVISMMAVVAFLFSVNANASETPKDKKKAAKTEKSCSTAEKKECAKTEKKAGGCCAAKKVEEKK